MTTRGPLFLLAPLALGACGGNYADVPDDLVDAIKHPTLPARPDSGAAPSYPPPPYGTQVGDIVQNLCFVGWRDPKAAGFDPNSTGPICIDEYFDPSGTRNKLLLIESCAVWCEACRGEYGGSGNRPSLSDHLAARETKGFRVLGTIFQNASADPATTKDAAAWARTYDLSFPFAVDDQHTQLGLFTPSTIAPFNMLIDTRSMKIVLELPGDEPATLFQAVDDFLAKNAGP
jgi:hypothetical protein